MMDAASKQIEAGESWMPFMPGDRVLLDAARPNGAEQSDRKEDESTDDKHGIVANVLDELHRSNENKMSDGGRGRASLGAKEWKSSQK
jgi:hypothetical protein